MSMGPTIPHEVRQIPVRAVRVTVIEGPDQGSVADASGDRITVGTSERNDVVLTDETVSRFHLELSASSDQIHVRDCGSTNGTLLGNVRLLEAVVPPGAVITVGKTRLQLADGEILEAEVHGEDRFHGIVGRTAQMRRLMAKVQRVAKSDVSVLVLGETGTGKEVVARAIHDASPRASGPFETVDCGALLPTLVASELFGHERGAFTGAEQRHVGAFERAAGGTLFLDEIGELPPALQASLLGALERRSFRRVGGTTPVSVDVRVVAATNRDLRAEVNGQAFREDLYFRLAVVLLALPPLRERVDDIPALVEHFVREAGHAGAVESVISSRTLETLRLQRWRGNVRELKNFVDAALAMGEAPELDKSTGADELSARVELSSLDHPYRESRDLVLRAFEDRYLPRLLERSGGNVAKAAREAGMDRTYLSQLLKRRGLK